MEAITIAGLAVVAVGGIYSVLDLLADIGIQPKKTLPDSKRSTLCCGNIIPAQSQVKKMAGMHI